jgi:nitrate reductase NapE
MAAQEYPAPQRQSLEIDVTMTDNVQQTEGDAPSTKTEEWRSFFFFTVVMAPVLAVAIVSGYGFIVWMYQLIAGPPGS